jgi:hypothetical protein
MGHESAFDFQPLPFHLVGGIIQPRFQLGQKVQQLVAQLFVGFGERAAESVEGVLPGGFAVCVGKFVDRFGLDEICLAVDKSPEAEFAGQGGRKALLLQTAKARATTAPEPWQKNSTESSPVKERGALKTAASTSSMRSPPRGSLSQPWTMP